MNSSGSHGFFASTDQCHLWLICRPDLSHLLPLLCLPGCCDHPLHVLSTSNHQSIPANLHWACEASWWVYSNALCCQNLLDSNLLAQHVQPQLTLALSGNDLDSIIKSKSKMVLGKLWSFSFWLPGGKRFHQNQYKNYPKNGLIYPKPIFVARSYDQTLRP